MKRLESQLIFIDYIIAPPLANSYRDVIRRSTDIAFSRRDTIISHRIRD